jgi:hypothetical protein
MLMASVGLRINTPTLLELALHGMCLYKIGFPPVTATVAPDT